MAVKHFQEHWDGSVEDAQYAAMFKEAFAKTWDLIDAKPSPVKATMGALNNVENIPTVRKCFDRLFAEDEGNLENRLFTITTFIQKMNALNQKNKNKFNDWHLNFDRRTAMACLNLFNRKDNYFYKNGELKNFCQMIGVEKISTGESFSLDAYYSFCNKLLEEIIKHKQLMEINAATLARDNSAVDDNNHILVYDVINDLKYFVKALIPYFEKKIEAIKTKIAELEAKKTPLKSLVGLTLESKTYGTGVIISETLEKIKVKFSNDPKERAFMKEYIGNTFFIKDEEYLTQLQENGKTADAIKQLEAEIEEYRLAISKVEANLPLFPDKV